MRKRSVCCAVLLLLLSAATYAAGPVQTDLCDYTDGKPCATYDNLGYSGLSMPFSSQAQGASDDTSLKMLSMAQPAQAVYQVENPDSVQVFLYTKCGTFATYDNTFKYYRLGSSGGSINAAQTRPCVINEKQEIFLKGEAKKLYYDKMNVPRFYEADGVPESGLPHLGLTIEASRDGTSYQPVEAALTSVETYSKNGVTACYGEWYTGRLPSGTVKIRLTLRDVPTIQLFGTPKTYPGVSIELAQVTLTGGGFAQPDVPPESGSQSQSSSSAPPPDISGSDSGQDEESGEKDEEEKKDKEKDDAGEDDVTADGNSSNRTGGGGYVSGSGGTRVVVAPKSSSASQESGEASSSSEESVVIFPQTETVTNSVSGVERGVLLWAAVASLALFGVVYWMFRR